MDDFTENFYKRQRKEKTMSGFGTIEVAGEDPIVGAVGVVLIFFAGIAVGILIGLAL